MRIHNPVSTNPRKKKPWTYQHAAARKDQAERFVRDVLEDDDRADEIADMSTEEYAGQRGKELAPNPRRRKSMRKKVSTEQQQAINPVEFLEREDKLREQIDKLKEEKESLQDRLDQIGDIVQCDDDDCDDADHLDAIEDVVNGAKHHGPRHGRGDAGEEG